VHAAPPFIFVFLRTVLWPGFQIALVLNLQQSADFTELVGEIKVGKINLGVIRPDYGLQDPF